MAQKPEEISQNIGGESAEKEVSTPSKSPLESEGKTLENDEKAESAHSCSRQEVETNALLENNSPDLPLEKEVTPKSKGDDGVQCRTSSDIELIDGESRRATRQTARLILIAFNETQRDLEESIVGCRLSMKVSDETGQVRSTIAQVFEQKKNLSRILRDMEGIVLGDEYSTHERQFTEACERVEQLTEEAKIRMEEISERFETKSTHSHRTIHGAKSTRSSKSGKSITSSKSRHSQVSNRSGGSSTSKRSDGSGVSNKQKRMDLQEEIAELEASLVFQNKEAALREEQHRLQEEQRSLERHRKVAVRKARLQACLTAEQEEEGSAVKETEA